MRTVIPNPENASQPDLQPIKMVAARLSISTRKIYRLVAAGEFPRWVKVGHSTMFHRADVENYLASLTDGGNQRARA